jgi:branched-chain amino acid transport system substrate-binding protein
MSRWRGYVVVLVAGALAAAGCTRSDDNTAASVSEVKIGLLAPLTGADQSVGEDARRGAQFAADLVNGFNSQIPLPLAAQSGLPNLGGARLRITPGDIAKPGTTAAGEVIRLTGAGAIALVGATAPEATLDGSLRAEKLQVPFMNADTGLSFLTERGLDWFFHVGPSARTVGEAYFSLLKQQQTEQKQVSNVAVLHTNDKAGNDVSTVVGELAQEGGFKVVKDVSYDPVKEGNAVVLSDRLSQIANATPKPDVVFLAPTAGTVAPLAAAFNALQYKPAGLMTFGSGLADAISKAAGPSTGGMCRATSWSADLAERNPAARAVQALYQSKFKSPMSEEAASTFTAVYTLALAINDAGSTDNRKVRSSLLSLNLTGDQTIMPWDGIQFDETHQNQGAESVIEQFVNKGFRPVFPRDAVSSLNDDLVWPAAG